MSQTVFPEAPELLTQVMCTMGSLPLNALESIEAYFAGIHVWFPLIEKHEVYRTYHKWSQEDANTDASNRACLLAILAYQEARIGFSERETSSEPFITGGRGSSDLFTRARKLISIDCSDYRLPHIQALLVLSLIQLGAGSKKDAWLLVGQATRMTLLLKAAMDQPGKASASTIGTHHGRLLHALSGCFVLDTLVSAAIGLPQHLRAQEFADLGHLNEDVIEEWDSYPDTTETRASHVGPAFAISTFNRLVQVTKYFSQALTRRSHQPEVAEMMEVELESWDTQQKPNARLVDALRTDSDSPLLPHQATVHLLHLTTNMVINLHASQFQRIELASNDRASQVLLSLSVLITRYNKHWESYGSRFLPSSSTELKKLSKSTKFPFPQNSSKVY